MRLGQEPGALLTSWELKNENIPHTVIVDNAGGT